jgi:hypothetical protein
MRRWTAAIVLGSLSCSDYKFADVRDPTPGADDADTGIEDIDDDSGTPSTPGECDVPAVPGGFFGFTDACPSAPEGGFTPIVEWTAEPGKTCRALPAVGDLDGDGMPEIVLNISDQFDVFGGYGELVVLRGDGSGEVWRRTAQLGYAASPAIGDVTGDGRPDIVVVKEYENSLFGVGSYAVVLYDADGVIQWESDRFIGDDFDYASAPVLSDMDHDGSAEIVVGRVILNADGSTRGIGSVGRGSFGIMPGAMSEGSVPAVADLDLDGTEEVIVGNAMYSPDGTVLWADFSQPDGITSVANLDDDPEGEFVAVSFDTVRAVDTDGTLMWGPFALPGANIVSPAAIGDIDADGDPEIIVAGGNEIWALERDGTLQWSASVHDETGATGPALFDFEGDGIMEVVYIDEIQMVAFDGVTGATKFHSTEHSSDTMYDYPVIADVDGDDQAEIVVCHAGFSTAMSVYGDADESWPPARKIWNQHAYSITNINDDLSIPVEATPNFTLYNNYHAAIDRAAGYELADDVSSMIADVCIDECDSGRVLVTVQLINLSEAPLYSALDLALYAVIDGDLSLVATSSDTYELDPGYVTEGWIIEVDADLLAGATGLRLVADDDGTGTGTLSECSEADNADDWPGPFCE